MSPRSVTVEHIVVAGGANGGTVRFQNSAFSEVIVGVEDRQTGTDKRAESNGGSDTGTGPANEKTSSHR